MCALSRSMMFPASSGARRPVISRYSSAVLRPIPSLLGPSTSPTLSQRDDPAKPSAQTFPAYRASNPVIGIAATAPQHGLRLLPERAVCSELPRLEAVSYTHLRAHETRHDLVCRL